MKELDKAWSIVHERFGYPNINYPKIIDLDETAYINMKSKDVVVSKKFLDDLNMDKNEAFLGILSHEVNHHVTCPYDLTTNFVLQNEARKVTKDNLTVANYFFDVVINLDIVNRGFNEIASVYKSMQTNSFIDNTLKNFYCYKTNEDFGFTDVKVDKNAIRKLYNINFDDLSLDSQKENIKLFAKIIEGLLENQKDMNNTQVVVNYKDVIKTNSKVIGHLNPQEYLDYTNKDLLGFYEDNSKHMSISVEKANKNKIITNYAKWQGSGRVNPYKSFGKYLPNISKTAKEIITKTKDLPNAVIAIDSSISMPNPYEEKSFSVIGSFCIANYYLKNKKEVATINFSNNMIVNDYSLDEEKIKRNLLLFQANTTYFDFNKVSSLFVNKPDFYMLTDMGIENLEDTFKFLSKNLNRGLILNISNEERSFSYKNLRVQNVNENKVQSVVMRSLNGI